MGTHISTWEEVLHQTNHNLRLADKREITEEESTDLLLAYTNCKHVIEHPKTTDGDIRRIITEGNSYDHSLLQRLRPKPGKWSNDLKTRAVQNNIERTYEIREALSDAFLKNFYPPKIHIEFELE